MFIHFINNDIIGTIQITNLVYFKTIHFNKEFFL